MKRIILLLSICFTFILMLKAYSANWYVDNSANGKNNGVLWEDAWESFSSIDWDVINPGDTIFISGCANPDVLNNTQIDLNNTQIYYETLNVGKAGLPDKPITIRVGQDNGHNGTVIIDAQDKRNDCIRLREYNSVEGDYHNQIHLKLTNSLINGITAPYGKAIGIVIKYVEIYDCGSPNQPGGFAHGILIQNAEECEISYSHIHDNLIDGINLGGSSGSWGRNKIHHNHIHHNGDDGVTGVSGIDIYNNVIHDQDNVGHPDGIQTLGNYIRIYNNEIYDVSNSCIFTDPLNMGTGGHIRIFNNLLYQTNSNYPYCRGIEVKAETGTNDLEDILIANNTIVDFTYRGISIAGVMGKPMTNIIVKNNIVYNCYTGSSYGSAISVGEAPYDISDVIIDYNLLNAGSGGVSQITWQGVSYSHSDFFLNGFGQEHGIFDPPEFIRYTERNDNNDYHLSDIDNAARENGENLSDFFSDDKDGNHRTSWDLGCYEYSESYNVY